MQSSRGGPTVPNHMAGAILATIFCCQITGIVAIVYAAKVNTKLAQGDIDGAICASQSARTWIGVSLIPAILYGLVCLVSAILGALN